METIHIANTKHRKALLILLRTNLFLALLIGICYCLFSFTTKKIKDDFLTIIGINKTEANERVASSMLGGYMNSYGANKIKNLAVADRLAVAKDMLAYAKNYVASEEFKKQYALLKEENKPQENNVPEAPEKYKAKIIAQAKEAVKQAEEYVAKATPENKELFKPALEGAKKNLKEMEDPNNEFLKMYADNYSTLLKMHNDDIAARTKKWNEEYPANANMFVKKRLEEFLQVTENVDYSAQLKEADGKKYFVNAAYEQKDSRWKMAYRAGKDVVETSRDFARQWLSEIK